MTAVSAAGFANSTRISVQLSKINGVSAAIASQSGDRPRAFAAKTAPARTIMLRSVSSRLFGCETIVSIPVNTVRVAAISRELGFTDPDKKSIMGGVAKAIAARGIRLRRQPYTSMKASATKNPERIPLMIRMAYMPDTLSNTSEGAPTAR